MLAITRRSVHRLEVHRAGLVDVSHSLAEHIELLGVRMSPLGSDLLPVCPSGVDERTRCKLGESTILRSGDECSEQSWMLYDTHNVCTTANPAGSH
ncbi:hypothetical protein BDM02DRAFT_1059950 [Thelephora ganbajun]|uniref:Uncharacterized protein n=1 Tax=Thelephora ganbajun TaxID=370292 RepID=A0ACB6Z3V5_THEGA|nr:hypothetical protein BDM02DRAFT_1059950 [Thelephora ganbajun]